MPDERQRETTVPLKDGGFYGEDGALIQRTADGPAPAQMVAPAPRMARRASPAPEPVAPAEE